MFKPLFSTYTLYLTTVAVTAACGLVVEIVAGRMLAPYLGMSIYTWTAIIAVVLAGFSVGHWIGGYMADWPKEKGEKGLIWVLFGASLTTAASLILIRLLSGPVLSAGFSPLVSIVLLTMLLFFLPSFFVGIPSPILTKLAIEDAPDKTGKRLGAMFAAGAFGSIIGTLLAGFLFISWLGSIGTILLVAITYLILGLVFFYRLLDKNSWNFRTLLPALFAIAASLLVLGSGYQVKAFSSSCDEESQYYCIRILDMSADAGEPAKIMILDHLGHGMNVKKSPQKLLSQYVDLQDLLVRQHLGEKQDMQAYFVGGGAYTLPRAWQNAFSKAKIHISEIDPAVTKLARKNMWFMPDEKISFHHQDARQVLNNFPKSKRFDVIVGDAFHDIAVPQHLITREFFQLIHGRLNKSGIYIMNVVDFMENPKLMLSVFKSLKISFPVVEIWVDEAQIQAGGRATFVLLAGQKKTQTARMTSRSFPERRWSRMPDRIVNSMQKGLKPILLSDDYAPVDRLLGE